MVENGRIMEHLTFQRGCQATTRAHKAKNSAIISRTGQSQSLEKHGGKHRRHTRSIIVEYVYMHPVCEKMLQYSNICTVTLRFFFFFILKHLQKVTRFGVLKMHLCGEKKCASHKLWPQPHRFILFSFTWIHTARAFNSTTSLDIFMVTYCFFLSGKENTNN